MISKRTKKISIFIGGLVLAVAAFTVYQIRQGNPFDTGAPLLASAAVDGKIQLVDDGFDIDDLPKGWVHRTFFNVTPTDYKLVDVDDRRAMHCSTDNSGSILGRDVDIKLSDFSQLKWQWKIEKALNSELDEDSKDGDDHPARFFVMFKSADGSRKVAEIIWSNQKYQAGDYKIINGFHHLVANGLDENVGVWHEQSVDLEALYKRIGGVGGDPSLGLLGFFCDSDNTGGSTSAYFSDVRLEAKIQNN
ncbi:MAG: DUF3047 domain-containing protein [Alphaproteobacteria bacterium]|nr:DUF3047 domain-containing protein [Alphaproteobacteria bacterium]